MTKFNELSNDMKFSVNTDAFGNVTTSITFPDGFNVQRTFSVDDQLVHGVDYLAERFVNSALIEHAAHAHEKEKVISSDDIVLSQCCDVFIKDPEANRILQETKFMVAWMLGISREEVYDKYETDTLFRNSVLVGALSNYGVYVLSKSISEVKDGAK